MKSIKATALTYMLVVPFVFSTSEVFAHDLDGIFEERRGLDLKVVEKLEIIDKQRRSLAQRVYDTGGEEGIEAIVRRFLLWQKGAISVCFLDGSKERWAE